MPCRREAAYCGAQTHICFLARGASRDHELFHCRDCDTEKEHDAFRSRGPCPLRSYANGDACARGPNACDATHPCEFHPGFCGTGLAGGLRASGGQYGWTCARDLPKSSFDSGSGTLCYFTNEACMSGARARDECQRWCCSATQFLCSLPGSARAARCRHARRSERLRLPEHLVPAHVPPLLRGDRLGRHAPGSMGLSAALPAQSAAERVRGPLRRTQQGAAGGVLIAPR